MSDSVRSSLERVVAGRYTIERELGRGGMGTVYLARDLSLDRYVAIKVLPPDLAFNPVLRERFVREAKLAASLSHPNIVHVHAVEEQGDLLLIVMQYVDGETLSQRIARSGPYDEADCARLLQDAAWALGYAHARGIVHRDVKPDNLMIERGTGRVLIMDFGIARSEEASSLTEVGQSIGSPHYMSPEQAAAEEIDGRSDLYSLGCVGFFAATGRTPFVATAAHRLLMLHMTQAPQAVSELRPEFPRPLGDLIGRLLSKDRAERFATGEALAEAINELHLRAREIAPLLRLFHQQTAQSMQTMLTLSVMFFILVQFIPRTDEMGRVVTVLLFATIIVSIVLQLIERIRFVVRQGFTAPDVVTAVDDIVDETARARVQLMSDPVERARNMRRRRFAMVAIVLGAISQPVGLTLSSKSVDGLRRISTPGVIILLVGTVLIGLAIAIWAMRPVRISAAQRLAGRFLRSGLCRALFARAERRYAGELSRAHLTVSPEGGIVGA
jgi:eukaryotic-like serine/threonine-protein kinase